MKEYPIIMSKKSIDDIIAGRKTATRRVCNIGTFGGPGYSARVGDLLWVREAWVDDSGAKKPPLFMPKRKARLWLKVTSKGTQFLCQMTDQDAIEEGYNNLDEYRQAWNKLNAQRGYPWRHERMVWVIKFEVYKYGT